jgi:hypothetical protein
MLTRLWQRITYLWRHRQLDADLAEELEFHRQMKQAELEHAGVPDAGPASRRALGNQTHTREDVRAVWVWRWFDDVWRDLVFSARHLRASPGYSATAIATLAIIIGANTTLRVGSRARFLPSDRLLENKGWQAVMIKPVRCVFVVWVLLTASLTSLGQAGFAMSSHRTVSPTVVASWYAQDGRLTLLVLWRGNPGWFMRAESGGGGGGGDGTRVFQQIREGGLTFRIDYDFASNTANIAGTELSLLTTNVVLMDFVDSPAGPSIVATRYVSPELTESRNAAIEIIRRESDLYPFLQCDLPLPPSADPEPVASLKQSMITMVCEQMRP